MLDLHPGECMVSIRASSSESCIPESLFVSMLSEYHKIDTRVILHRYEGS
jgi:hypothetical protein